MSDDTVVLSQEAYDRLAAELEDRKTRQRTEIARHIEAARELGDLSENGDYQAAKEEQANNEQRIAHLARVLREAEVRAGPGSDDVSHGSIVEIRFEGDDDTERYLVGSIEERHDHLEVVSASSPMGQALLGAEPGQTVTYEAPNGATVRVEVVSVGR